MPVAFPEALLGAGGQPAAGGPHRNPLEGSAAGRIQFLMSPALTAVIQARIDPSTKETAERILDSMGLSTAEALRLFCRRIAASGEFPWSSGFPIRSRLKRCPVRSVGGTLSISQIRTVFTALGSHDFHTRTSQLEKTSGAGSNGKRPSKAEGHEMVPFPMSDP